MTALETTAARSSVEFTEEMLGHVTFGESDYQRGAQADRDGAAALMFHLTIAVDDIDRFANDPRMEATADGFVRSDALGGRLPVERGVFNLFVDHGPGVKRMLYRLFFRDGVGHPLTLIGHKVVRDDPGFDVWRDTTTLFTRVLRGHVEASEDETAEVVAAGVLRIRVRDFAKQLTTFRAGGPDLRSKLVAVLRFGWIFMGHLAQVYVRKATRSRGKAQD
jgi:cholesterol oxidase